MMSEIYFDAAATVPPDKDILDTFIDVSQKFYANPSALHSAGLEAERSIRASSEAISRLLGASKDELYFTSGGTESNNMAILGMAKVRSRTHKHIITQLSEHPSVIQSCKRLESEGFDITWLTPDKNGIISTEQIGQALREDTGLVAIIHVNNETGCINDIEKIGAFVKQNSSAYFFSDGVQGFGKFNVSLKNIDAYSFSGHKIGCIKGIGGLFLSSKVRIIPQIIGGGQQNNLRSGTENTAGIAALAKASEKAFANISENRDHMLAIKNKIMELVDLLPDVYINVNAENSSPYILNMSFIDIRSEVLLHALAEDGIFLSAGSACSAGKKDKERNVLYAMGYERKFYESAVRLSFSPENTMEEAEKCINIIAEKVNFLRKYTRR